MAHVLMISKPVEAPWNDSSKNLVRDLAGGLAERHHHVPVVLTRRGSPPAARRGLHPGVQRARVYPRRSDAPQAHLLDLARLATFLGTGVSSVFADDELRAARRAELWHLFFAPNPRSSLVLRGLRKLRQKPSVQTVASAPRNDRHLRELLFSERVVALSRHTARRLEHAGIADVRVIPPAAPALSPISATVRTRTRRALGLGADALLVLYPGDLEFSKAAHLTLEAFFALRRELGGSSNQVHLVMACRAKTARAQEVERALRERAMDLAPGRVHWVGETDRILELLGSADLVALPADDLYAKMDYPLAVLEAMMMERPVIVGAGTPAAELAEGEPDTIAGAIAVETRVEALAEVLLRLLEDDERRDALGRAARAQALRDHHPARLAAAYESVYDELC